jgi:membrane-anchored protein YejM (alkaline phosphatase superfamily)
MTVTLAHFFVVMALVELVVLWRMTSEWRLEDDRLPEAQRRPYRIVRAAALLTSAGLVAFGLLHPIGEMPVFEI